MAPHRTALALLALAACGTPAPGDTRCASGLCDEASDPREQGLGDLCEERRADAFNPNHESFTPVSLRWSCKDAADLPEELQGQEYCESFAVVQLPASGQTIARGQQIDDTGEANAEWSERYVDLSAEDFAALDEMARANPQAEAGACVFTSWHSDRDDQLPVCPSEDSCQAFLGLPLSRANFRMRHPVNSLDAAANLVFDCLQTFAAVTGFDGNPVDDDFTRGCLLNQLINRTSYRKSDTTVCSAALRLTECGCHPKDTDRDFPELLGALDLRGFHLASWDDRKQPPIGCHYIETGDVYPTGTPETHNLVACPLTADEILDHASTSSGQVDLKTYCDDKYADDVVVHVLINPLSIECDPDSSPSPFAGSCPDRAPYDLEP